MSIPNLYKKKRALNQHKSGMLSYRAASQQYRWYETMNTFTARLSIVSSRLTQRRARYAVSYLPFHLNDQRRDYVTRQTRFKLNTGASIPAIGFGTFQDPNAQEEAVSRALQAGLRLIDTARVYDVESQVGRGIKASGVPREEIFLGTKLWCNDYHPDDVERALDQSLAELDTPYVDLLMMHYPCTFKRGEERFPRDTEGRMIHGDTAFIDTWKAMEKMVEIGKVKALGVSNFSKGELETLIREGSVVSLKTLMPAQLVVIY